MTWTTRPRSEVDGLAAIVAGDGPTMVLLHGVGLRAEAWAPVIDAFAPQFRVIAPDLPGHGASPAVDLPDRLAGYADRIAPLLRDTAIVVGHSMGAMIALNLAVRDPDQTRGVAALNAIYRRSDAARTAVRTRAAALDGHSTADPSGTLGRWFGQSDCAARVACRDWLTSVDPAGYRAAYSVFADQDGPTGSGLRSLRCPALFMTGADEPNSTPDMSREMADLAPLGRAVVLPGAAHMMPMTHPDATIAALSELAKEVGP